MMKRAKVYYTARVLSTLNKTDYNYPMLSIQARISRFVVRRLRSSLKKDIYSLRQNINRLERFDRIPHGVQITQETGAPVPAEWTVPLAGSGEGVLLYFHGGGFVVCSPRTHRTLVAEICTRASLRALSVDYRLAPEHPFPAALEDTTCMVHWLVASGIPPKKIVLGGDSAGGNLVLATLLKLRDTGAPLPAAAFCLSPVTDLSNELPSRSELAKLDPLLPPEAGHWLQSYAASTSLRHPLLSPLQAELHGLPPLLLQVGTHEILLDDSRFFTEKARQTGVNITLEIYPGMWHVFQTFGKGMPESRKAIQQVASFIQQHLNTAI
jgi:acetyl esterase/lipase